METTSSERAVMEVAKRSLRTRKDGLQVKRNKKEVHKRDKRSCNGNYRVVLCGGTGKV